MPTKLASNNPYPKVIFVEQGSTPSTPASGQAKVFVRSSDGHLCRIDDGGTVFDIEDPGAPPSGSVLQVVNTQTGAVATGSTAIPIDDSIPQKTEGDQYMSLSITPQSASSKLKIEVVWNGTNNGSSHTLTVALFQDSTADALASAAQFGGTGGGLEQLVVTHFITAGTTSATTFKVRAGANFGTTTFNGAGGARYLGGSYASSITITEIAA